MHWLLRGTLAVGLAIVCLRAIDARRTWFSYDSASFLVGSPRAFLDVSLRERLCILCRRQDTAKDWLEHPLFIRSYAFRPGSSHHGLEWVYRLSKAIVYGVPQAMITLIAYGLLTCLLGPRDRGPGRTMCRKCTHILRRLSEPQCPECGERI